MLLDIKVQVKIGVNMGGKIKRGYSIITGVVKDEIKEYIDSQVKKGIFRSRCHAVGCIITKYVNKNVSNSKYSYFNAYKPADKPTFTDIDYSLVDENYRVL